MVADPRRYWVRSCPTPSPTCAAGARARARAHRPRPSPSHTLIENARGRTETAYNDAIAPRPHPRPPNSRPTRSRPVRNTRRGTDGKAGVLEVKDQGCTFHQTRSAAPRRRRRSAGGRARRVQWFDQTRPSRPAASSTGMDGPTARRTPTSNWEDAEWLRDRAEATKTSDDESASTISAIARASEKAIVIVVALTSSERTGWLAEKHERLNEMLEHATTVIDGAPTTRAPATDSTSAAAPAIQPRDRPSACRDASAGQRRVTPFRRGCTRTSSSHWITVPALPSAAISTKLNDCGNASTS